MLHRFSLYGFLKNQRYFESFLVLAMLEAELTFTHVGLLIALRESVTTLLEIPSGAIADVLGRRRSMVVSFLGYVVAYLVLGLGVGLTAFAVGMALIGVGDAFRTGTHKAMIFDWLASQGREEERVQVYGYTRSWSQLGSALALPIAAGVVWATGRYAPVFLLAAVPAAANVVNLATYPRALDGEQESRGLRAMARHLRSSLRAAFGHAPLRRLLLEAAVFTGGYKATKDYLQPVVATLVLALPWLVDLPRAKATAVGIGVVYVVLHLASALASRRAHRWVDRFGDVARASWWLWVGAVIAYATAAASLGLTVAGVAAAAFVVLAVLHNLFRPVLVSRVDAIADRKAAATVLSLESQAGSTAAIVIAPLAGAAIDLARATPGAGLWTAPAVVAVLSVVMLLSARRSTAPDTAQT